MENDLNSIFKYVVKRRNMINHFYDFFKKAAIKLGSIECWFDNIKSSYLIPEWFRFKPEIVPEKHIFSNRSSLFTCLIDSPLVKRGEIICVFL